MNKMIIAVGEILFDHFPTYRRLGGAPFNFAYHLKRLGIPVRFISRVGDDAEGEEILETLARSGFDVNDIQIDADHPTGRVRVHVDARGVPVFSIEPDAAYDYLDLSARVLSERGEDTRLIYFGSLIQRTGCGRAALRRLLTGKTPNHRCLCDINLRPGCYDETTVRDSLAYADILKLNEDELGVIGRMTGGPDDPASMADLMKTHHLEMVSLTKGDRGSELVVGGGRYAVDSEPIDAIADTVGAGDAYAAMVAVGYLKGWRPERILSAASRFSGRLCTIEGAIPPGRFYDEFRTVLEGEGK